MLEEIQFSKKSKSGCVSYVFAYSGKMPQYNVKLLKRVIPRLKDVFYQYRCPFILTIESNKREWYFQIEESESGCGKKRRSIFIKRKGFNITY
jgi:hypothetical protein